MFNLKYLFILYTKMQDRKGRGRKRGGAFSSNMTVDTVLCSVWYSAPSCFCCLFVSLNATEYSTAAGLLH